MILPLLVSAALLAGLSAFSMDILSSVRAYVGAEGLYSKAQKDAVLHLSQYVNSHQELDYQQFLQAIAVPLGDRKARLALDRRDPDLDAAYQGFLAARNHPDDIDGMIWLFRNFRNIDFMSDAIAIWAEADGIIHELITQAKQLHLDISSGHLDDAALDASLARIKSIDLHLNSLEDAFSSKLGDASRKAQHLLLLATVTIASILMGVGSLFARSILKKNEAFELQLARSNRALQHQASLLNKARDAIIVHGMDQRILLWNASAERLYGWTEAEALGRSRQELASSNNAWFEAATAGVMERGEWNGEVAKQRKDGSALTVESRWTLVRDDDGQPQSIFAIDTDITERKAAEHEIELLAFYDPLTLLPNRRLLMDRLQQALVANARSRHAGALLFIDLDNFKTINDTLGHDTGDLLLRQAAVRLVNCVRASDTVARLGGDEFVVMLLGLNDNPEEAVIQAKTVGEKIVGAFSQPYQIAGIEHLCTSSIGITMFKDQQDSVGELLKRADLAMYQAKAAGRNTMRLFDPVMQTEITTRVALEADLRQAMPRDEFLLHYQPQVDGNGHMTGVEALLRWQHPRHGLVSPVEFIPLAEDTGLILPLGLWVLETACAQLAAWASRAETAQLNIAVNVSVQQFRHPHFVAQVMKVLDHSAANPHRLKLELTESLMVNDMDLTIAKMTALKGHGVSFSLDDFGTGYSSLSYLKRLPLDQLKIDQSFVKDVFTDPNDAVIARTIVALAQSLGLAVIAEGVETEAQRDFLAGHGCHAYQGYLFSRPLPIDKLEEFMRENSQPY